MNLGRKSLIPWEGELVVDGGSLVPPTPEKPIVQRSGYVPVDTQQNLMGSESWHDLLGIYSGLLQDEPSNGLPQEFSAHNHKGTSHREASREAAPVKNYSGLPQNFASGSLESIGYMGLNRGEHTMQNLNLVETCNQLPQNRQQHSFGDPALVKTMGYFSQEKASFGSRKQNVGCVTPRKVDSLAELIGTDTQPHTTLAHGVSCRGANILVNPAAFNSHSQVESRRQTVDLNSSIPQKTSIFAGRQQCGNHNLHQGLNNGISLTYQADYIPNAHQRVHATSSYLTIPFQFEPPTPDQRNQMKNQVMDVSHFLASDTSLYQEKNKKDGVVFDRQNEKFERMHNGLDSTLGISAILTSTEEYINSCDGNGEIDLNKKPQQKPREESIVQKLQEKGIAKELPSLNLQ